MKNQKTVRFLLIIFALSFMTLSMMSFAETEVKVVVTADLGTLYFPSGKPDTKLISDFTSRLEKNAGKSSIMFDLGRFAKPPITSAETTYSANPVALFKKLNFAAVNLAYSDAVIKQPKIDEIQKFLEKEGSSPVVSSVQTSEKVKPLVKYSKVVKLKDFSMGVYGLTDRKYYNFGSKMGDTFTTNNAPSFISEMLAGGELNEKVSIKAVLSDLPLKDNEKAAESVSGIDIIFCIDYDGIAVETPVKKVKNTFIVPVTPAPGFAVCTIKTDDQGKIVSIEQNKEFIIRKEEREKLLTASATVEMVIGEQIKNPENFVKLGVKYDSIEENKSTEKIPGFNQSNKTIYYYSLIDKNGKKIGDVFYNIAYMNQNYWSPDYMVYITPDGKVSAFYSFVPQVYAGWEANLTPAVKTAIGKSQDNFSIDKSLVPGVDENLNVIEQIFKSALAAHKALIK